MVPVTFKLMGSLFLAVSCGILLSSSKLQTIAQEAKDELPFLYKIRHRSMFLVQRDKHSSEVQDEPFCSTGDFAQYGLEGIFHEKKCVHENDPCKKESCKKFTRARCKTIEKDKFYLRKRTINRKITFEIMRIKLGVGCKCVTVTS